MKRIIFMIIILTCLMTCDFFEEVNEMSSEKVLTPTPGAPVATDDYNAQNGQIQAGIFKFNENFLHLTNWDNLLQPAIKQGVYVSHGGALFIVNDSDEAISGSPSNGRVYIRVSISGDNIVYNFVNSAIGYVWNYEYCGFYNGAGDQLLPYILVKSGSNWYKHTLDTSMNKYNIEAKIIVNEIQSLGLWDMDTDLQQNYDLPDRFLAVYGSPSETNDVTLFITSIDIKIRNDNTPGSVFNITGINNTVDAYYVITVATSTISIIRYAGGFFDDTIFSNNTTIIRGTINWYYKI